MIGFDTSIQPGTAHRAFRVFSWADATHYEGVPTDCMCPGNISNGSVRGDNDNNEVNVHDLFALLANWGECGEPCAPFCAGDISGAHGLPDCAVDMFDLMAVLERWGKCE